MNETFKYATTSVKPGSPVRYDAARKSKFICADSYLISRVPHDDSAMIELALS